MEQQSGDRDADAASALSMPRPIRRGWRTVATMAARSSVVGAA